MGGTTSSSGAAPDIDGVTLGAVGAAWLVLRPVVRVAIWSAQEATGASPDAPGTEGGPLSSGSQIGLSAL